MVLPGASPTRAKFLRFSTQFITDDLPTLDLPANTTEGSLSRIKPSGAAADLMNSALFRFNPAMYVAETKRPAGTTLTGPTTSKNHNNAPRLNAAMQ